MKYSIGTSNPFDNKRDILFETDDYLDAMIMYEKIIDDNCTLDDILPFIINNETNEYYQNNLWYETYQK
jgi:hypothetical protein